MRNQINSTSSCIFLIKQIIQEGEQKYSGRALVEYLAGYAKKYPKDSIEWNVLLNRAGEIVADML